MLRNWVSSCLCHYDSRDTLFVNVVLSSYKHTLSRTWLGLKEVDVESKVLAKLEMQLVLPMQIEAL